jgi:mannose-1-phosphate guanylyltransferase/phosphomannomutase
MKAILLASGKGERLGTLARDDKGREIPKPMIRIGGKPVLEHNVIQMKKSGIENIYITLHHLPDAITAYFGDGARFGVHIDYWHTTELLGTAGVVKALEGQLTEEPFFVVYGDSYSNYQLDELLRAHSAFKQRHPQTVGTIGLWEREDVVGKAVIVGVAPDGLISRVVEKPRQDQLFPGYLVNTGHYLLEPTILEMIPDPRKRPSDFAKDIFPRLVEDGLLCGVKLTGWLKPYDTPELLASVLRWAESEMPSMDTSG